MPHNSTTFSSLKPSSKRESRRFLHYFIEVFHLFDLVMVPVLKPLEILGCFPLRSILTLRSRPLLHYMLQSQHVFHAFALLNLAVSKLFVLEIGLLQSTYQSFRVKLGLPLLLALQHCHIIFRKGLNGASQLSGTINIIIINNNYGEWAYFYLLLLLDLLRNLLLEFKIFRGR